MAGSFSNNITSSKIASLTINNHAASTTASTSRTGINNCLPPVRTFVDREESVLENISQMLEEHGILVLTGMGGVGKTQLARKYSTDNAHKYTKYIYWLEAETEANLKESLKQLAQTLDVKFENNKHFVLILKELYGHFTEGLSLLIFDNVEKTEDMHCYLPVSLGFENKGKLHILITSRRSNWTHSKIQILPLHPLSSTVALKLFKKIFGEQYEETSEAEWKILAENLGFLPLALQVAASYIKYYHYTVTDYITQLKTRTDEILDNPLLPEYNNRSIYSSMMITLKEFEKKEDRLSKLVVHLLNVMSYFDPDYISKNMLFRLGRDGKQIVYEALIILRDCSLINKVGDSPLDNRYSMHRMIQSSIRHNQKVNKTMNDYFKLALDLALAFNSLAFPRMYTTSTGIIFDEMSFTHVFRYCDEFQTFIVEYYKQNPEPVLIKLLVYYKYIEIIKLIFLETTIQSKLIDELLQMAVMSNNIHMVKLIHKKGADVNRTHKPIYHTPLHIATGMQNEMIVKYLLENGADSTIQNEKEATPLHDAARLRNEEIVRLLIKNIKPISAIDITNHEGKTPLHEVCCSDGNADEKIRIIRTLVDSGADITKVDKRGRTVLYHAASVLHVKVVSFILQVKRELINITDNDGRTALHVVASYWYENDDDLETQIRVIRTLLANGADITKVDKQGWTVLHCAAHEANVKVVSLILQMKRELIDVRDNDGRTALHVVSRCWYIHGDELETQIRVIRTLVDNDADITKVDKQGWTVLHFAAHEANVKVVSFILQMKRELIDVRDNDGQTALHVVTRCRYIHGDDLEAKIKVIRTLVDNGADITKVDKRGWTVLHFAAEVSGVKVISFILHMKRELINITDNDGRTALHVVCNNWHINTDKLEETIRVLVANGLSFDAKDKMGRTPFETVSTDCKHILLKVQNEYKTNAIFSQQLNKELI